MAGMRYGIVGRKKCRSGIDGVDGGVGIGWLRLRLRRGDECPGYDQLGKEGYATSCSRQVVDFKKTFWKVRRRLCFCCACKKIELLRR